MIGLQHRRCADNLVETASLCFDPLDRSLSSALGYDSSIERGSLARIRLQLSTNSTFAGLVLVLQPSRNLRSVTLYSVAFFHEIARPISNNFRDIRRFFTA